MVDVAMSMLLPVRVAVAVAALVTTVTVLATGALGLYDQKLRQIFGRVGL